MTLDEYQKKAISTDVYKTTRACAYGLISEIGELFAVYARKDRDGTFDPEDLLLECGDICWHVAALAKRKRLDFVVSGNQVETIIYVEDDYIRYIAEHGYGIYIDSLDTLDEPPHLAGDEPLNLAGFELSAILHEIACLLNLYGYTLSECFERNIEKLRCRVANGTLHGKGGHR
jgi:NTP pyrophosphatase (non-canonical NTP hydrolase)